jgi:hypothetical protein
MPMKIISPFKDYYDHIAYIYGVDNTIVYNRNPFDKNTLPSDGYRMPDFQYWTRDVNETIFAQFGGKDKNDYSRRWLCIMGKFYLQVTTNTLDRSSWKIVNYEFNNTISQYHTELMKLHKHIQAPVFVINSNYWRNFNIDTDIPILKDSGIASIISPEKMYQDISYFIGNVLKDNPDTLPPVNISDKDKLTQAGFDAKMSFRHRK